MTDHMRVRCRSAVAVLVLLVLAVTPTAWAESGKRVVRAELAGEAGDVITCYDVPAPVLRTLSFAEGTGRVLVTVVHMDDKNVEVSTKHDSKAGVPMMVFPIRKVTVEFVKAGTCVIELYAEKK